jgi:hypothetical protein
MAAQLTAQFDCADWRETAGLEKRNRLLNPKEREIVAYHEIRAVSARWATRFSVRRKIDSS